MLAVLCLLLAGPVGATEVTQSDAGGIEIAAALCLSGDELVLGQSTLDGIQLALDEANARNSGPKLRLKTYDEASNVDAAKRIAAQIVDSRAPFVLGSVFSFLSLVEGPIFAQGGVAALATATSDLITRNPTSFACCSRTATRANCWRSISAACWGCAGSRCCRSTTAMGRPCAADSRRRRSFWASTSPPSFSAPRPRRRRPPKQSPPIQPGKR